MKLIYDGPRTMVRVQVGTATIEHGQGAILDYPNDLGKELLASKRQRFRVPTADEKKAVADAAPPATSA